MILVVVLISYAIMQGIYDCAMSEGTSMFPTFSYYSFYCGIRTKDVKVGDIINYYNNETHSLVVHRIISYDTNRDCFVVRGDNNGGNDRVCVTNDMIKSKYWFSIKL